MKSFCDLKKNDIVKIRTSNGFIIAMIVEKNVKIWKNTSYLTVRGLSEECGMFHMNEYEYAGQCTPEEEFAIRMEN